MRWILLPLLLVAAVPGTAMAAPTAVDFEQAVAPERFGTAARTAASAAAWHVSAPLRAPRRFDLLGFPAGTVAGHAELRVRRPAGGWSPWTALHDGEPAWTGGARIYQLRTRGRPPAALRLHFVAVTGRPERPPATAAAGLAPRIVPRSAWDPGNRCRPRVTPIYGRVDFAMVHHTVSLNAYGPSATPAIVLGICRFHRNANKWNDMGYNLLVDRYGVVYEGREGGVREPLVGAQAQGWNTVSTGVAAIGSFGSSGLPAGALRVLARTIAWKLSLAGVPAQGSILETSIGGDLNRWRKGARVRFQRIAGHRDGDLTECPGAGLYAQLPALRALVADLLPPPRDLLTISPAPASQPAGGPVLLTGRLARADGRRPSGQPLALQVRVEGAWTDVVTVVTGPDGIWSTGLPLAQNAQVRIVHAASGTTSPAIAIPVRAGVRLQASARTVRLGGALALSGTTHPPKGAVRIVVERRLDGASKPRYRRVRTHVVAAVEGAFELPLRLPTAGTYRVIARTTTDRVNASGASRGLIVRVRPRR